MATRRWKRGEYAAHRLAARELSYSARSEELEAIERMLVRHHGCDPNRAQRLVWGRPDLYEYLGRRGRPPKPHLIRVANRADETLARGGQVRWDVVHRGYIFLNHPGEARIVEYGGERFMEPRDSENWQRAVRRIRNRLRAQAAAIAREHGLA